MTAIILSTLIATVLTGAVAPVAAATYDIIRSHAGDKFFEGLTFFDGYDNTTNGDVFWVKNSSLAYVADSGKTIIKVDNTTFVPWNEKRNSVKLKSDDWYKPGTVMVLDATHLPYGCSVWPAWWTQGPNWFQGGEIDIVETINRQAANQYALHTVPGCIATPDTALGAPLGRTGTTDCDHNKNSGSGCTVYDQNELSTGEKFANAGGGVFIMAFETPGITIWFHTRANVPAGLTADAKSIDTSKLGTPTASYSSSSCEITKYFGSQQMILDITLCGDWAGLPDLLQQTWPPLEADKTCYTTYVINEGTAYDQAYFEINYINIFGTADSVDTSLSPAGNSVSPSSGGSSVASASVTTTTTAGVRASTSTAVTTSSGTRRVAGIAGLNGLVSGSAAVVAVMLLGGFLLA